MVKARRQYSKEFKEEAVRLATSGNRSLREVAASLDVDRSLLKYWTRAAAKEGAEAFRGQGKRTAADDETWRLKLRVQQLEEELEFLKKSEPVLRERSEVKYRYLSAHKELYSMRLMCRVLGVTPQGYSQWTKRAQARDRRRAEDQELRERIRISHVKSRRSYGRKRVTEDLRYEGHKVSEKRVGKLMKLDDLRARAARRFKVTTNSHHDHPIAPNTLDRNFKADAPNQKWVGDITYLWTEEGWLYLAVVMDLYSRKIVGWSMNQRISSELVCAALRMAVKNRGCGTATLCHFDRGSQYTGELFQLLLRGYGFQCSMSRKGNCWDNAVVESFFHSLKIEAIYGETFRTRNEARRAVFDWLEGFYNTTRRHSSLGYLSPMMFERRTQEVA